MSASRVLIAANSSVGPAKSLDSMTWYAIRTRSRYEKVVERQLHEQGIEVFYPVTRQIHHWSDRRKLVDCPLFAGYAFVRIVPSLEQRVRVLQTRGVVEIVGAQNQGVAIQEEQINAVRTVVAGNIPFSEHVFLKVGQRVRVRGGSLDGMEGLLVSNNSGRNLVISVEAIHRSISIDVEGYQLEPV